MNKFYVYRFMKEKKILYVGKTKDINKRMKTHFSKFGHLPKEYYSKVERIEYVSFDNKIEMDMCELYFINLYKPEMNTVNKLEQEISLSFNQEFEWVVYKTEKELLLESTIKQNEELKDKVNNLTNEIRELKGKLAENFAIIETKSKHRLVSNSLFNRWEVVEILKNEDDSVFKGELTSGNELISSIFAYRSGDEIIFKDLKLKSDYLGEENKTIYDLEGKCKTATFNNVYINVYCDKINFKKIHESIPVLN